MLGFIFVRNVWFRFCTKCLVSLLYEMSGLVFVRDVVCTNFRAPFNSHDVICIKETIVSFIHLTPCEIERLFSLTKADDINLILLILAKKLCKN